MDIFKIIRENQIENAIEILEKLSNETKSFKKFIENYSNENCSLSYDEVRSIQTARLRHIDIAVEFTYAWENEIRITFYQIIKEQYGEKMIRIILNNKYDNTLCDNIGKKAKGYFARKEEKDNWIKDMMEIINFITDSIDKVYIVCHKSSNFNKDGTEKRHFVEWRSSCQLLRLCKEMPIQHIYHANKDNQAGLDNSPWVHGSNGTYVENVNPFWTLYIKIKRPSYEVPKPCQINLDVHDYITKRLMPKLGWGKISSNRLEVLNNIIENKFVNVVTNDTSEAALYRNFHPIGYNSWDEYLDELFSSI